METEELMAAIVSVSPAGQPICKFYIFRSHNKECDECTEKGTIMINDKKTYCDAHVRKWKEKKHLFDALSYLNLTIIDIAHRSWNRGLTYRIGLEFSKYVTIDCKLTDSGMLLFSSALGNGTLWQMGKFVEFVYQINEFAKSAIRLVWHFRKWIGRDIVRMIMKMLWKQRIAWARNENCQK